MLAKFLVRTPLPLVLWPFGLFAWSSWFALVLGPRSYGSPRFHDLRLVSLPTTLFFPISSIPSWHRGIEEEEGKKRIEKKISA